MKNIIITGASGLVATELASALLNQADVHLYLLSTHIDNIVERYKKYKDRVHCFTLQAFTEFANASNIKYNFCIHTAFSRTSNGNSIVASINYQRDLIELLVKLNVSVFVNISSQSVYGKSSEPLWTEKTPLDPDYLYAMGKYFSEVLTQEMLEKSSIKWTNIRLCSVCEKARFINVFVQNAIKGIPIELTAPEQQCSFIDVQDVASGLMHFIEKAETISLLPVYNLGANLVYTIAEVADMVKEVAEQQYGQTDVRIIQQASNRHEEIGMDSMLFMDTFAWRPKLNMKDMITEIFEMYKNPISGVFPISFKFVYGL